MTTRHAPPSIAERDGAAVARPSPAAGRRLWSIQILRGVAALMVVIGHSQSAIGEIARAQSRPFTRLTILPWGASVDLFFVVSGFIMIYAQRDRFGSPGARGRFLRGRLTRIAPPYWMATAGILAIVAVAALKGGAPFPTPAGIAASLLFVPWDSWGTGRIFPILDLGWTLNYEMFFYGLFALFLGFRRDRATLGVIATLLLLAVAGGWVRPEWQPAYFWTRPILVDFGLGAAIGALCARDLALPPALRTLLLVGGVAVLVLDPAHVFDGALGKTVGNGWLRVVVAGVPAAAIVAACVLGREGAQPRIARPGVALGDASYSLYLFHPFALVAIEKLVQKSAFVARLPLALLVLCTVAGALAVAAIAYRWIETPLTRAAHRLAMARAERSDGGRRRPRHEERQTGA